eukprot:764459-Hanusia_phi.AAC.2
MQRPPHTCGRADEQEDHLPRSSSRTSLLPDDGCRLTLFIVTFGHFYYEDDPLIHMRTTLTDITTGTSTFFRGAKAASDPVVDKRLFDQVIAILRSHESVVTKQATMMARGCKTLDEILHTTDSLLAALA